MKFQKKKCILWELLSPNNLEVFILLLNSNQKLLIKLEESLHVIKVTMV